MTTPISQVPGGRLATNRIALRQFDWKRGGQLVLWDMGASVLRHTAQEHLSHFSAGSDVLRRLIHCLLSMCVCRRRDR
jgi:hypothetical protein